MDRSRTHEMVHVRQFERWSIFLLPTYLIIGWWLSLRGYDPYLDHPFESEANSVQDKLLVEGKGKRRGE